MSVVDSILDGINRVTRNLPIAREVKRRIKAQVMADRVFSDLDLFVPNSRGSSPMLAEHAWLAAKRTFPVLATLADQLVPGSAGEVAAEAFCTSRDGRALAAELKRRFDEAGSDKGAGHGYHWVYGEILAGRTARHLLEVGIGTPNTRLVSHMGEAGRPGASLRAFRDALPEATIRGADIDPDILFTEERIRTHRVDQRDPLSFAELRAAAAEAPFDVVIDDGLHVPDANLTVLGFALEVLAPKGWLVIEDIKAGSLPVWVVVRALLERQCETWLVRADSAYLLVARRRPDARA